ncbi:MAG: DnaB-like helicase N-terminal domain-containing protein [Alistipes finegoldii]
MAKDYNPSQRNREAFEALTDTAGNVPPQAVELEEAVLGALMLEKDSIIAVQEYVTPDAFYTEEHRTIYRAIEELSMELKPIDLYTVTERLKAKKEAEEGGRRVVSGAVRRRRSARPQTSNSTPRSSPRSTCSAR